MKRNVFLTVVMTALNEEGNVVSSIERLTHFLEISVAKYEIIFVNDGSTDDTSAELEKVRHFKNLKIINLSKNLGTGGAIKKAMPEIRGEWYCWLPADLEIQPQEILKALNFCDEFDVVVTYLENGHLTRTKVRNLLSSIFTFILNKTFNRKLKYFNGVSLIKTSLLNNLNLNSNRFFFHAELLLKVLKKNIMHTQVPILLSPRASGQSKAMKLSVFMDVAACFVKTFWNLRVMNENSHY